MHMDAPICLDVVRKARAFMMVVMDAQSAGTRVQTIPIFSVGN